METITKYKADDGREFLDAGECRTHEENCSLAENIMSEMCPRPGGTDFANGSGYIQHEPSKVLEVRAKFLEFCKRYTTHKWIQESIDKGFEAHASWAARIIGEAAPDTIYKHWHRFSCIDSSGREWGQPFYADHPEKAESNQLNA